MAKQLEESNPKLREAMIVLEISVMVEFVLIEFMKENKLDNIIFDDNQNFLEFHRGRD